MRVVAIVQARYGSSRLPGKVLADICGVPMLARHVARVQRIPRVDEVVVATTVEGEDSRVERVARAISVRVVRGSVDDVLERYRHAAAACGADVVVRVTADCPLLMPDVSGLVVSRFLAGGADYVSNIHPATYPDGLDTEVFSAEALEIAYAEARLASEREHVTPYIWKNAERFRIVNVANPVDLSHHRWTVDEAEDLAFVREAYSAMLSAGLEQFGFADLVKLLSERPDIASLNEGSVRNAGYQKAVTHDTVCSKRSE